MIRIWLPPLDICCNSATIELVVAKNETVGIKTVCFEHHNHFIESPFASSKKNIKIRFSKDLLKLCGIKKPKVKASSEPTNTLFM